jgi:hypothetical protein
MNRVSAALGRAIARYLEKQTKGYVLLSTVSADKIRACLRPGDVLLVEGNRRISSAIKYLTQSTWSHAAMFVGDGPGRDFIEADLRHGVRYVGLEDMLDFNLRICRPVGLTEDDCKRLIDHMRASVGHAYDLKNVIDLARYLLPQPPVPKRFRRRMLALGSGDPTRAICSSLIAEAFQSIRYPVLPMVETLQDAGMAREILHIKHYSLFAPRDFDVSPYFQVVKPTIEQGFDYKALHWAGPAPVGRMPQAMAEAPPG